MQASRLRVALPRFALRRGISYFFETKDKKTDGSNIDEGDDKTSYWSHCEPSVIRVPLHRLQRGGREFGSRK